MTEKARVLKVHDNTVSLQCIDGPHCDSCGSAFCNLKSRTIEASVATGLHVNVGDEVEVFVPPSRAIASGFLVLIVPLILFLTAYLSFSFVENEAAQVAAGFGGLVAGFLLVYIVGRRRSPQLPTITHVSSRTPDRTNRPPALSLRQE